MQERFEEAAKIRDQIETIKSLKIDSGIDLANDKNFDIFAIVNGVDRGVVVKLFMRNGKIISSSHSYFRRTDIYDKDEAYKQALLDFYMNDLPSIPKEILVAHDFQTSEELSEIISKRVGKKIVISHPKRGNRLKLTKLSILNANELLKKNSNSESIEKSIKELFELEEIPYRVGAMVVWDNNRWDKASYRRYELTAKDEYGQMTEMLQRRIKSFDIDSPPDLWLLDGGTANLNLAIDLLKIAGINLQVIAIAKEKLDSKAHRAKGAAKDIIYTLNGKVELKTTDKRLQWLQRLRDESHRFVIAYHQNRKRRDDTQISLLNKKGIGKATIKKLIDYFGTFENIEKATFQEIKEATNSQIADILYQKKSK